ncbi:MAG TPA: hypothetical protein P5270_05740 [Victivallales bacterium]|nr:hypothetical protein [Victivallales bacterium]
MNRRAMKPENNPILTEKNRFIRKSIIVKNAHPAGRDKIQTNPIEYLGYKNFIKRGKIAKPEITIAVSNRKNCIITPPHPQL